MRRSNKSAKGYNWWIAVIPDNKIGNATLGSVTQFVTSFVLLTSKFIPSEISDNKNSVFQEIQMAGYNYNPTNHVRNDNTIISFTVPVVNRRRILGNQLELNGFERLRNQQINGIGFGLSDEQIFSKNPIAIYSGYGTHRPPLPVQILKCDFKHRSSEFTNTTGFVEWTDVTITMQYIENSILYQAYKKWRNISSLVAPLVQMKEKWEF